MIGLMDCNNFFVSCERLFRPDLKGKPVAVLSSNDGCIISRSQEVKDLGVPMGMPFFQVNDTFKNHHITIFSSNFPLYRDLSRRVMSALEEEFDSIEVYSIDEAFFELPKDMRINVMEKIRDRIIQKTGIPVSFGVAPTKTIAKLANSIAKKGNGVALLTTQEAYTHYEHLTCGSVWGIGRQMSRRFNELHITTVSDFLNKGLLFARQEFGVVGERLFFELSGTKTDHEKAEDSIQGTVSSTRSFETASNDQAVLMSALGHHVAHVGQKLREHEVMATELRIICAPSRYGPFSIRSVSARQILEVPTNDTAELLRITRNLFDRLYEKGVPYKKAGAIVSGLIPEKYVAPSLFEENVSRENSLVYTVVDALNERFGRGTIHSGVIARTDAWAASSKLRSQEYTTNWSEIVCVKAI